MFCPSLRSSFSNLFSLRAWFHVEILLCFFSKPFAHTHTCCCSRLKVYLREMSAARASIFLLNELRWPHQNAPGYRIQPGSDQLSKGGGSEQGRRTMRWKDETTWDSLTNSLEQEQSKSKSKQRNVDYEGKFMRKKHKMIQLCSEIKSCRITVCSALDVLEAERWCVEPSSFRTGCLKIRVWHVWNCWEVCFFRQLPITSPILSETIEHSQRVMLHTFQKTTHRATVLYVLDKEVFALHNMPGAGPSSAPTQLSAWIFLWWCSQQEIVWLSSSMLVQAFPLQPSFFDADTVIKSFEWQQSVFASFTETLQQWFCVNTYLDHLKRAVHCLTGCNDWLEREKKFSPTLHAIKSLSSHPETPLPGIFTCTEYSETLILMPAVLSIRT